MFYNKTDRLVELERVLEGDEIILGLAIFIDAGVFLLFSSGRRVY